MVEGGVGLMSHRSRCLIFRSCLLGDEFTVPSPSSSSSGGGQLSGYHFRSLVPPLTDNTEGRHRGEVENDVVEMAKKEEGQGVRTDDRNNVYFSALMAPPPSRSLIAQSSTAAPLLLNPTPSSAVVSEGGKTDGKEVGDNEKNTKSRTKDARYSRRMLKKTVSSSSSTHSSDSDSVDSADEVDDYSSSYTHSKNDSDSRHSRHSPSLQSSSRSSASRSSSRSGGSSSDDSAHIAKIAKAARQRHCSYAEIVRRRFKQTYGAFNTLQKALLLEGGEEEEEEEDGDDDDKTSYSSEDSTLSSDSNLDPDDVDDGGTNAGRGGSRSSPPFSLSPHRVMTEVMLVSKESPSPAGSRKERNREGEDEIIGEREEYEAALMPLPPSRPSASVRQQSHSLNTTSSHHLHYKHHEDPAANNDANDYHPHHHNEEHRYHHYLDDAYPQEETLYQGADGGGNNSNSHSRSATPNNYHTYQEGLYDDYHRYYDGVEYMSAGAGEREGMLAATEGRSEREGMFGDDLSEGGGGGVHLIIDEKRILEQGRDEHARVMRVISGLPDADEGGRVSAPFASKEAPLMIENTQRDTNAQHTAAGVIIDEALLMPLAPSLSWLVSNNNMAPIDKSSDKNDMASREKRGASANTSLAQDGGTHEDNTLARRSDGYVNNSQFSSAPPAGDPNGQSPIAKAADVASALVRHTPSAVPVTRTFSVQSRQTARSGRSSRKGRSHHNRSHHSHSRGSSVSSMASTEHFIEVFVRNAATDTRDRASKDSILSKKKKSYALRVPRYRPDCDDKCVGTTAMVMVPAMTDAAASAVDDSALLSAATFEELVKRTVSTASNATRAIPPPIPSADGRHNDDCEGESSSSSARHKSEDLISRSPIVTAKAPLSPPTVAADPSPSFDHHHHNEDQPLRNDHTLPPLPPAVETNAVISDMLRMLDAAEEGTNVGGSMPAGAADGIEDAATARLVLRSNTASRSASQHGHTPTHQHHTDDDDTRHPSPAPTTNTKEDGEKAVGVVVVGIRPTHRDASRARGSGDGNNEGRSSEPTSSNHLMFRPLLPLVGGGGGGAGESQQQGGGMPRSSSEGMTVALPPHHEGNVAATAPPSLLMPMPMPQHLSANPLAHNGLAVVKVRRDGSVDGGVAHSFVTVVDTRSVSPHEDDGNVMNTKKRPSSSVNFVYVSADAPSAVVAAPHHHNHNHHRVFKLPPTITARTLQRMAADDDILIVNSEDEADAGNFVGSVEGRRGRGGDFYDAHHQQHDDVDASPYNIRTIVSSSLPQSVGWFHKGLVVERDAVNAFKPAEATQPKGVRVPQGTVPYYYHHSPTEPLLVAGGSSSGRGQRRSDSSHKDFLEKIVSSSSPARRRGGGEKDEDEGADRRPSPRASSPSSSPCPPTRGGGGGGGGGVPLHAKQARGVGRSHHYADDRRVIKSGKGGSQSRMSSSPPSSSPPASNAYRMFNAEGDSSRGSGLRRRSVSVEAIREALASTKRSSSGSGGKGTSHSALAAITQVGGGHDDTAAKMSSSRRRSSFAFAAEAEEGEGGFIVPADSAARDHTVWIRGGSAQPKPHQFPTAQPHQRLSPSSSPAVLKRGGGGGGGGAYAPPVLTLLTPNRRIYVFDYEDTDRLPLTVIIRPRQTLEGLLQMVQKGLSARATASFLVNPHFHPPSSSEEGGGEGRGGGGGVLGGGIVIKINHASLIAHGDRLILCRKGGAPFDPRRRMPRYFYQKEF